MRKIIFACILATTLYGCKKELSAPVPNPVWALFESNSAIPVTSAIRRTMEGVYEVTTGSERFGNLAALRWSYVVLNNDTTFSLSIFTGKDIGYFICQGKSLDSTILFNGYWRKMVNTETGISRFTISPANGSGKLFSGQTLSSGELIIEGVTGNNQEFPENSIRLKYLRPLNSSPYQILAHRGGGRTSDLLPVSENSVEIIKSATAFGATGVEIDVRLTSDGIPILYHDNTLNLRLIQDVGLVGPVEDYTFNELKTFVRLINGERIPTLREALDAVVYNTSLEYVWLDTKYIGSLSVVRQIQQEYYQKAALAGRSVEFLIGLPGNDQVDQFRLLPDYTNVPSLCELTLEQVRELNSKAWGPRWTQGLLTSEVEAMHAEGRKVFVWTLDVPEYIQQYVNLGNFDGILTNYPAYVAYSHYTK